MNDYKMIRRDPSYSRLRSIDMHVMHNESLRWLEKSLNESTSKTNEVVSHHAPSIKSIPEKYRNDLVSAGYASDLENFIRKTKPDLWIHGHIHEAIDYTIGDTRVICNPKGYPGENADGFRGDLIINID
jgi:Icc-related predicted phosphoesterase